MKAKKILDAEIDDLKISSLPTRPTAPTSFGGKGYTTSEMKEAFDRLPLYIIERFNELIDDIESGAVLENIKVDGTPLTDYIKTMREDIDALIERSEN